MRANPSDPQGLITLASALSERVRQGGAIELLWRAFEKTNDLDGKIGVIERLTQLYLENNQFDRLMERLERERREAEKARELIGPGNWYDRPADYRARVARELFGLTDLARYRNPAVNRWIFRQASSSTSFEVA